MRDEDHHRRFAIGNHREKPRLDEHAAALEESFRGWIKTATAFDDKALQLIILSDADRSKVFHLLADFMVTIDGTDQQWLIREFTRRWDKLAAKWPSPTKH